MDSVKNRINQIMRIRKKRTNVMENLQLGYDQRRSDRLKFRNLRKSPLVEGDKVLLWRSELEKQWSGKLEPRWKGPYIILRIYHNGTYDIGKINGDKFRNNPVSGRFLKKYYDELNNTDTMTVKFIEN